MDARATLTLGQERHERELAQLSARLAETERNERLLAGESRILEMVARGQPLPAVLAELCRLIEELSGGALCGILLVDPTGERLEHGAAPNLPESYNRAIDGRPLNALAGPCGMAAHTRQQVLAIDVASDTRWDAYHWRELAIAHGLRACWSTPILSSQGDPQATFAIYWREPRSPTARDQQLINQTTHLAAVAIEHRRAMTALQQSEQRLRHIADTIPGLVWSVEPDGEVDFLNQRWRDYTGLTLADAKGWGWRTAIHPDDLAGLEGRWRAVLASGAPGEFEARLRRHDGVHRWFLFRAVPLRDAAGRVMKWYGQNIDIDDRRRAEDELHAAKARFEGILNIADDAVISIDSTQQIVLFNQGAEAVFGYAAAEVIGQTLDTLLPARFVEAHGRHIDDFARACDVSRSMAQRREVFGRRKDGSEFPAEASISKLELGDEVVFTVILRDVTERKRLEDRLRRSEHNLAEGQRLTKTGSWVLDFKTGTTDWSVETCRIFGFPDPPPSPHYQAFRARVRPEDREAVDRGLRESFESGEPRPLEYVFVLPDGTKKNIETISQPVRDTSGAVVRLMGTVMDVTERKRTAEALRASEHVARGQLEALASSLAALSREPEPQKFLEHVLRITCQQLGATSTSIWEMNQHVGCVDLAAVYQDNLLHLPMSNEGRAPACVQYETENHPVWTEFFRTGRRCVFGRIESDPVGSQVAITQDGPWYDWRAGLVDNPIVHRMIREIAAAGVVATLNVPMLVAGKVTGLFVLCFKQHRVLRHDELDLTRAMSHQAMLAIQLMRLSQASREAAVIAERNRLARDIHDTLAQGFTGVLVQLEAAADAGSRGLRDEAYAHVRRARDLAREGLQEARRSVRALRPRVLDGGNLRRGLEELIQKMTAGTAVRARFVLRGEPGSLPVDWEDNLLRVGQEVLTNVLRHARATEFSTVLAFGPNEVRLELGDNGIGFDPQAKHDGFGLIGMHERVQSMGGQLAIESSAQTGTRVSILLPLKSAGGPA